MGTWSYKKVINYQDLNGLEAYAIGAVRVSGSTMTGNLNMNSSRVRNLPSPSVSGDAVEFNWAESRYTGGTIILYEGIGIPPTAARIWIKTDEVPETMFRMRRAGGPWYIVLIGGQV